MADFRSAANVRALKPEASLDRLRQLASDSDWTLTADEQRTHYNPRFVRFSAGRGISICWREDHTLEARTMWVESDVDGSADGLWTLLGELIPCWREEELELLADSSQLSDRLTALRTWTALAAGREPHAALIEQISKLAVDETLVLRLVALHLAWSGGWDQLLALGESRAKDDPDDEVRQLWQRWLDSKA